MQYTKSRGENRNNYSERRNTMKKLGMIIDILCGEVRLNEKIVKCGAGNNEHMRIKLRKKK